MLWQLSGFHTFILSFVVYIVNANNIISFVVLWMLVSITLFILC